jgi:hypothetical protein
MIETIVSNYCTKTFLLSEKSLPRIVTIEIPGGRSGSGN